MRKETEGLIDVTEKLNDDNIDAASSIEDKLNGAALDISEKAVNIPVAGVTAGVVTSSADENKVAVAEDGSMEVNSLNMSKLVQSEGDTLILDGGNASV